MTCSMAAPEKLLGRPAPATPSSNALVAGASCTTNGRRSLCEPDRPSARPHAQLGLGIIRNQLSWHRRFDHSPDGWLLTSTSINLKSMLAPQSLPASLTVLLRKGAPTGRRLGFVRSWRHIEQCSLRDLAWLRQRRAKLPRIMSIADPRGAR